MPNAHYVKPLWLPWTPVAKATCLQLLPGCFRSRLSQIEHLQKPEVPSLQHHCRQKLPLPRRSIITHTHTHTHTHTDTHTHTHARMQARTFLVKTILFFPQKLQKPQKHLIKLINFHLLTKDTHQYEF